MHKNLCILIILSFTTLIFANVTAGKWKKEWKNILEEYAEAIGKTKKKDFEKSLKDKKVNNECDEIEDLLKALDKKFKNKDKNPKIYKRDIFGDHERLGATYSKMHMKTAKYVNKMSKLFKKKKRKKELEALSELGKKFNKIKKSINKSFDKKPPSLKRQKLEELVDERDDALKKVSKLKKKLEDAEDPDLNKIIRKVSGYIENVREKLDELRGLYDDEGPGGLTLMYSQLGSSKAALDDEDKNRLLQQMTNLESYFSRFMQSYFNDLERQIRE
ncbi:hypothetical protein [Candidatus Uabimicrobium amorphum]|uniref:Uncharacterized protein n=1 Tax=Uabimicrobium amorphum TaxID=2596890 RepID=A0A5S9F3L1_UABAM|nr:hypothetical protein [Candidatus Uabimicrobium amorphum]BBM84602.1 hypothetical protein UABAM_02963 [Candidatus Uabimicrobium amorphum]